MTVSFKSVSQGVPEKLISHNGNDDKSFDLEECRGRLLAKTDHTFPLGVELDLLEQLTQFEFGRFLLANRGLNGFWTAYAIIHGPQRADLHPLEHWILFDSPVLKATRERFYIFRQILQRYVKDGAVMASAPCGLMDDLLGLDYSHVKNVILVGLDLDEKSLGLAQFNAQKHGIVFAFFMKRGAWNLGIDDEFDVITSNGLNIYEPDDRKVTEIYRQFYKALKPGGILVTSFLTPPPALSRESTWKNVVPEDAKMQKALLGEVIGVKWQSFRTEGKTREQLQEAGFEVLEIIYDFQGMFPTVVARKR